MVRPRGLDFDDSQSGLNPTVFLLNMEIQKWRSSSSFLKTLSVEPLAKWRKPSTVSSYWIKMHFFLQNIYSKRKTGCWRSRLHYRHRDIYTEIWKQKNPWKRFCAGSGRSFKPWSLYCVTTTYSERHEKGKLNKVTRYGPLHREVN